MPIPYGLVQALVRNDAQHAPVPGPEHELLVFDAQTAIGLFTVWDQKSAFAQCVAAHANPKALALATTLTVDVPVLDRTGRVGIERFTGRHYCPGGKPPHAGRGNTPGVGLGAAALRRGFRQFGLSDKQE